jgi:hypothetical protein
MRFDGADWAGSCPLRSGRHDGDQPGLRMAKMKFHFLKTIVLWFVTDRALSTS